MAQNACAGTKLPLEKRWGELMRNSHLCHPEVPQGAAERPGGGGRADLLLSVLWQLHAAVAFSSHHRLRCLLRLQPH